MPFQTLADLARRDESERESNDESDNEYYAGGESSGQTVRAPPNANAAQRHSQRMMQAILGRAHRSSGRTTDNPSDNDTQDRLSTVHGRGYRLGDAQTGGSVVVDAPMRTRSVTRTITFYRNGFTVDGEGVGSRRLRAWDDPEQAAFLEDVQAGVVPRELETSDLAQLNVHLVDRKHEDFEETRGLGSTASGSFQGTGRRLGDAVSSSSSRPSDPVTANGGESSSADAPIAASGVSIQVRLLDGSRAVARMDESSTVDDLRQWIVSRHPEYANTTFDLQVPFPKRVLQDDSERLVAAGLANAVVVQHLRR